MFSRLSQQTCICRNGVCRIKRNDFITGSLCALGCETLYGLSYIFTKSATQSASAFALLGWRFFTALIVMSVCAAMGIIRIHLKGKSLRPLLLAALFSPCIYFIGETVGISHTTASESGVFLACIPVASLIASTVILKKKPSRQQVAGALLPGESFTAGQIIGAVIILAGVYAANAGPISRHS